MFCSSGPTSRNIADRQIIWEEIFDLENFGAKEEILKVYDPNFKIFDKICFG